MSQSSSADAAPPGAVPTQRDAGSVLAPRNWRVACRLIVLRVPQEVAARRRQQAYEKARKHGRQPSRECLAWRRSPLQALRSRAVGYGCLGAESSLRGGPRDTENSFLGPAR